MNEFLAGQVCLVTGGAQGIGWAISQALAEQGAHVYACSLSESTLAQARQELTDLPWAKRIHLARCDVTQRSEIEEWIAAVYRETGRIDVLVNNAAFVRWDTVLCMSIEEAERSMRVGYDALVYSIKSVLPLMLAAQRGHIVNIGSSAGRIFVGGSSAAYAATKAAIDGYTQTLQVELKKSPVKVTLVRMGAVAGTDFFRKHVSSSKMPRFGDFVPYLTPPQVGRGVVQAMRRGRSILDMPRYLTLFYLIFDLWPGLFRWLIAQGGGGRRDYGQVDWRYFPPQKPLR